ncbi:Shedu immune nuclease family protein [Dokdonella sp.]|uniref:Shedu immune nuclease family protein n=1 Tax=Dokdonella sp. TaxID=2291710 RepID=UPI0037835563
MIDEISLMDDVPRTASNPEPYVELQEAVFDGLPCAEVFLYVLSPDAFIESAPGPGVLHHGVLIARVFEHALHMRPVNVSPHHRDFLEPKYGPIEWIEFHSNRSWELPHSVEEFEELLERLPTGFARKAIYGLGLRWQYRHIMTAIGQLRDATRLRLLPGTATNFTSPVYTLGIDRFDQLRRVFDRSSFRHRTEALEEKRLTAYTNLLRVIDPVAFPVRVKKIRPGMIYELASVPIRQRNLGDRERRAAVSIVSSEVEEIARHDLDALSSLREDIEKTTLRTLLQKMKEMMTADLSEGTWQAFLAKNPFVLSLAFSYPVFMMQDHAYVGGTTLKGAGEKIADFLYAQNFSGNLALIEIKRPRTELLGALYRGEVYPPHKELSGAVAQVLDQRFRLHRSFAEKAYQAQLRDVHPYAIHCVVIAGRVPEDEGKRRSLELFRQASKDVVVLTFDELLAKLEAIAALLTSPEETTTTAA